MNRLVVVGVLAGTLASAGALVAQEPGKQQQFRPPQCDLNTGHFLVNGAQVYLKGAVVEGDTAKKRTLLDNAHRSLLEAFTRGEEDNAAVWYFLGRYYEETHDPVGADSAFARAVELAPDCREDVDYHRQLMWVPLINAAVDSLRSGAFEGARGLFRQANALWDKDPIGFYYLGRIFGNDGEADSAIAYLQKVIEIGAPDTSSRADQVKDAYNSIAVLYTQLAQRTDSKTMWDSAGTWYRRYLEQSPGDVDAMVGLAGAYDESGQPARALALYDSIIAMSAAVDAQTLFSIGSKLFVAQKFWPAARAFDAGVTKNPYSRDGWYNLANSYLAMADEQGVPAAVRREAPQKMLNAAQHLVGLDPQNQETLRLLAGAYQLLHKNDSTYAVLNRVDQMKWEVIVDSFSPAGVGWGVSGRIKNDGRTTVQVPEVMFEFLDANGNVVGVQTLGAQSLAAQAANPFRLSVISDAAVGWRYKVSS